MAQSKDEILIYSKLLPPKSSLRKMLNNFHFTLDFILKLFDFGKPNELEDYMSLVSSYTKDYDSCERILSDSLDCLSSGAGSQTLIDLISEF